MNFDNPVTNRLNQMMFLIHQTKSPMLFTSSINYLNDLILCYICNSVCIGKIQQCYLGFSAFTNIVLSYGYKDATAARKNCHRQDYGNCTDDFQLIKI